MLPRLSSSTARATDNWTTGENVGLLFEEGGLGELLNLKGIQALDAMNLIDEVSIVMFLTSSCLRYLLLRWLIYSKGL